jgi:hypothetical protein
VQRIIRGDDAVAAHGNHDMPTWGDMFKSISADSGFAELRVKSLVDYLQRLQR